MRSFSHAYLVRDVGEVFSHAHWVIARGVCFLPLEHICMLASLITIGHQAILCLKIISPSK